MPSVILTVTLIQRWRSIMLWSSSMFLIALMFTGLYDYFQNQIASMIEAAPPPLQAFYGVDLQSASSPAGWLGLELYGFILPIVLVIIATGAGGSIIGDEENSGTLELLLSSPVSRITILVHKTLAIEIQLALVATLVWLGILIGTILFPFDISLSKVFWASFMAWLLGGLMGCLALFVQSLTQSRSYAIGIGAGILLVSYLTNILSNAINSLEYLRYVSTFHYYGGSDVLITGPYWVHILVLSAVTVTLFALALIIFSKRDTGI